MKTTTNFLKLLTVVLLLAVNVMDIMAQGPYPTSTSPQSVCLNSIEPYGVNLTAGSTYAWSISDPSSGTITGGATPNLITVNWTKPGNFTLQVIETNQYFCSGAPVSIQVTVNPLPIISPIATTTCSGVAAGVALPVLSDNSLVVDKWDIAAVVAPGLTGTATQGFGKTDPNAIAADAFTNITTAPLKVVYTVTPYTGACSGASFTITVTILPAPVVNPIISTTCSGVAAGVTLPVLSVNGLVVDKWNISAVVAPGLTGIATQGLGKTDLNAIAADAFTNTTTASLTVVYTVTPYAGTCAGASFTITVTILPAPVVNPIISTTCSGVAAGVKLPVLSENGLTVDKWDIAAVVAPGLTGTATQGLGKTDLNTIAADAFANPTAAPLTVVYTVTPYAGTCKGASFTITVTIYPNWLHS